jgi:hypothetical protein
MDYSSEKHLQGLPNLLLEKLVPLTEATKSPFLIILILGLLDVLCYFDWSYMYHLSNMLMLGICRDFAPSMSQYEDRSNNEIQVHREVHPLQHYHVISEPLQLTKVTL